MNTTPLLQVQDLVKHFPVRGLFGRARGAVRAVDGVSFTLHAGQTLGVVGESGCGKSTLGRLVLRLIDASAGRVVFAGTDLGTPTAAALRAQRRALQIIFQDPYSSQNPRMTVGQTLAEPLKLQGLHTGRHTERVAALLHTVGLPTEHAQRYPHEFSGGQRQRIPKFCRPRGVCSAVRQAHRHRREAGFCAAIGARLGVVCRQQGADNEAAPRRAVP